MVVDAEELAKKSLTQPSPRRLSLLAHHLTLHVFVRRANMYRFHDIMRLSSAVILASYIAMLPWEAAAQRWEPLPTCLTCVSRSRILSPAMGIDIEPTYL